MGSPGGFHRYFLALESLDSLGVSSVSPLVCNLLS